MLWPIPTERPFESYVDRQITEAVERGEFDDLAGAGHPLDDLESASDPAWWAKKFVQRERAREAADEVRRVIRSELPGLRVARDRQAAASRVAVLNGMIDAVNEHSTEGDRIPHVEL